MSRKIQILFTERDVRGLAELCEEAAPQAAELVWGLLSTAFVGSAVHAIYSGPAALVAIPERHGEPREGHIPVENETNEPDPGDVLLLPPDDTLSDDGKRSGVTLAIFYGERGRPLTPEGWVAGVRVAKLTDGLDDIREVCRALRFSGAEPVRLARAGGTLSADEGMLHTDGSSLGNPGPAGAGFVLTTMDGETLAEGSIPLEPTTVNVAEYRALIAGLAECSNAPCDPFSPRVPATVTPPGIVSFSMSVMSISVSPGMNTTCPACAW